jgi:hypothetical protein
MLKMIRLEELNQHVAADAQAYQTARPYKHTIQENFLVPDGKDALLKAFPADDWPGWDRGRGESDPYQPKKLTCANIAKIPEPLDQLIHELNSGPVLDWLEKLTGIKNLLPDPALWGGGLHSSGPGGKLLPHTDFHYGKIDKLHRRLNLLVYMNEGWKPENGGAFELWDQKKDKVEQEILPEYGRTVVFQTDADSLHGFSKPVAGRFRNSVAMYYYTVEAPERFSGDYATHWRLETNGQGPAEAPKPRRSLSRRFYLFSARAFGGIAHRMTRVSHWLESRAGRKPW